MLTASLSAQKVMSTLTVQPTRRQLAAGSSIGLTSAWRCMCSFELLMMDGKTAWNM